MTVDRPAWLIELPTCPSTSTWALAHVAALAHGACVWTQRQTQGRGQNGKAWFSPPGVLTASFVVDLPPVAAPAQLSLCVGLAVAHAVEELAPAARVGLRWPNDCCMAGRKLAGILCERPARGGLGEDRSAVVVGIGLNLDPHWDQSPAALPLVADPVQAPASVAEVCSPSPAMPVMLAALRRYLLEATGLLAVGGWGQMLPHLRQRDDLAGKRVELGTADGRVAGQAEGLDDEGRLRLRLDDGTTRAFSSASVLTVR